MRRAREKIHFPVYTTRPPPKASTRSRVDSRSERRVGGTWHETALAVFSGSREGQGGEPQGDGRPWDRPPHRSHLHPASSSPSPAGQPGDAGLQYLFLSKHFRDRCSVPGPG